MHCPRLTSSISFALPVCFGLLGLASAATAQSDPWAEAQRGDPAVRLEMALFGGVMQIEVRDEDRDKALVAMRQALLEMHSIAVLTDPGSLQPGSLSEINLKAGQEVAVSEEMFRFLVHGTRYCLWSSGVHGVLGGAIYELWDGRRRGRNFDPLDLRDAVASASCDAIQLDAERQTVQIEEGSVLSGYGLERGYAIDLGMAELQSSGIDNAIIETGELIRAMGPGTGGRGWLVQVPGVTGSRHPIDQIYLRDQSIAWVARPDGDARVPINQRSGVPTQGVRMVAVVTARASDSEALAHALYAMGKTVGLRHVGPLEPKPSIYWLLGVGKGLPLESPYRWTELDRVD